jgi:hypothetical protein
MSTEPGQQTSVPDAVTNTRASTPPSANEAATLQQPGFWDPLVTFSKKLLDLGRTAITGCGQIIEGIGKLLRAAGRAFAISFSAAMASWLVLTLVANAVHPPREWQTLSTAQKFFYPFLQLDFFNKVEMLGVLTSLGITLYLYWICFERGWMDQIPGRRRKGVLYLIPVAATFVAAIACVLTVGNVIAHLLALSFFFVVFIVWDVGMLRGKKVDESSPVAKEIRGLTEHWLIYVDIPTPLTFWALYLVSYGLPEQHAFLTGAIGAVLLGQAYDWSFDCARLAPTPEESTS